jgi:hypothetical protein
VGEGEKENFHLLTHNKKKKKVYNFYEGFFGGNPLN